MVKSKIEYDPSLDQLLIDKGFDHGTTLGLVLGDGVAYGCDKSEKRIYEDIIKQQYKTGCIIVLPWCGFFPEIPRNDYRADWVVVFYSPLSGDEIRRRLALKAFL